MIGLNKKKLWLFTLLSFVALSLLIFGSANFSAEVVQSYFLSSTWLAIVGFMLLYAIKSITMTVPNSVLYISAGIVFPTWLAILVSFAGLTVSLSVGYFMGQKLGETKVYQLLSKQEKIKNFLDARKNDIIPLCFATRLMALPFGFASFFFGALKAPFFKYIIASLLGVMPTMIPIVYSGSAITNPLSAEFIIPFCISIAVTVATFVVYKKRTATVATG